MPMPPLPRRVDLKLDPTYRATKTITQIYEGLIAEGRSPESLDGLRQMAEAERDPDAGPNLAALHYSYLAMMRQQGYWKATEERRENIVGNMKYHRDRTLPQGPAVWVFGSNLSGAHHGGAAEVALEKFGAKEGVCRGVTGQAYAIPTADQIGDPISLKLIAQSGDAFVDYANANPSLQFFVTRIGCGSVRYRDKDIAPLFAAAPANCDLPEEWGIVIRTLLTVPEQMAKRNVLRDPAA